MNTVVTSKDRIREPPEFAQCSIWMLNDFVRLPCVYTVRCNDRMDFSGLSLASAVSGLRSQADTKII